jgi:hypothetical protein
MVYLQITLCRLVQVKGIKNIDACIFICTLCICDVRYTSPSFVINVVILERSFFKPQNLTLLQKYFSPTFFTPNEMEKFGLELC